ncbi:hypothetical protein ANCCAN_03874 [Ancylostoma caninum]|uniref:Secreted protein n=1 Tax=Ancylostoma caninum TaxID=29170 RepID=A0A368H0E1_ANCCA|nr:hypothetical protein ANCCAN_03874 [Ancylostoma caninum]
MPHSFSMFRPLLPVIIVVLVCSEIIGARVLEKQKDAEIPESLALDEGTTQFPEADEGMMPEENGEKILESSPEDSIKSMK